MLKLVATLIFIMATTMTSAESLTIERIYSDPELSGPTLRKMAIAPDGSRVTFLRGKASDQESLDLWEYHVKDGETRMLVDARQLVPQASELSDEEKARRERQRIAGLRGIVEYQWSPDGTGMLFPLNGDLYFYELATGNARQVASSNGGFITDPKTSPGGRYVSYVQDQNLHLVEIATGEQVQLTNDGQGLIKNGMAEFIAQEEMDRDTGYWWAPDASHIAFIQIDESPVDVVERYEISAETFTVFEQRYPAPGTNNVTARLGVVSVTGDTQWLDLGKDKDIYLARVDWMQDSRSVLAQVQPRDQQSLSLIRFDLEPSGKQTLVGETSNTWINLHHNLKTLADESFLWTSERTGYSHIYRFDKSGRLLATLTAGNWVVDEILCVDESSGRVYFSGTKDSPLEQHLYWQSLDGSDLHGVQRVTQGSGWHDITLSNDCSIYVDQFSHPRQPTQVALHSIAGKRLTWLVENKLEESHPYFPYLSSHIDPEFGILKAADGQTLHYRLTPPAERASGGRFPVVVAVYGGPGVQRVRRTFVDYFEQYLAQHGIGVFSLDNRGSTRRGVAFEAPIHRLMGEVEVADQVTGAGWLAERDWVDPGRIGTFGWSYGGYMTQMMLMKAPNVFAAGVAVAPVTDWLLYDTHYTERYLGLPAENAEGYRRSGTLPYVDQLTGKLLVMHGMADDNVLFTHSTKLFKALQDQGTPFEMMNYPGGKHSLAGKRTRIHVFEAVARFLTENL